MSLRAKKPSLIKPRLKALFYGMAGTGKTTASISFPNVYLIDTEQGAIHSQYIKQLEKSNGAVFQTQDFDELIQEVKALMTTKHEYKTLIIDPLTTLYNDLLEKSAMQLKNASKEKDATGTEFGRHYSLANSRMKHLLMLLSRLDMNVIITSHAKNEYGHNMTVLGSTFDCYKKLDYLFDLVLELQKRGKERVGIVKKTRLEEFPDGDVFTFSYDEIANRYGREILEKDSVAEVLATKEQVQEIIRLIDLLKVPEETYQKWLDKNNSATFTEMSNSAIEKCIEYLKSKVSGNEISQ